MTGVRVLTAGAAERATVENQGVLVSVGSWGWMGEGKEDMAHSTTCVYGSRFSTRTDSLLEKHQDYLLHFFGYGPLHGTFHGDPWYFAPFCCLFSLQYFTKFSVLLMDKHTRSPYIKTNINNDRLKCLNRSLIFNRAK